MLTIVFLDSLLITDFYFSHVLLLMKAIEDDFRVTTGFLAWRDALILIMRFQTMKIQDEYCKSKSGKNFKTHLHIEFPLQKANHRTFSLNEESAVTANKGHYHAEKALP